jgi:spore coat polysaccharide biosynthesis protein SpsF
MYYRGPDDFNPAAGKVLKDIHGKPAILRQIERIESSRYIDTIIVATTTNPQDDELVKVLEQENILYYRGSEDDVLGRVADAARYHNVDIVVEITGDCPLVDMNESDKVIERFLQGGVDMASNNLVCSYPIGMDTIVFSRQVLEHSALAATDPVHREHVCLYLYEHPYDFNFANVEAPPFLRDPGLRMTLDEPEDYQFICQVYEKLYPQKKDFTLYDMMKLLNRQPEMRLITSTVELKKVR